MRPEIFECNTLEELRSLYEATVNIGKDVDYIYDKFYKGIPEAWAKEDFDKVIKIASGNKPDLSSKELKTRDSKKGHEALPVLIKYDQRGSSNNYNPLQRYISLQLSPSYLQILRDYPSKKELSNVLGSKYDRFKNEFSESRIKATIYHELAHWLDDALHGGYITKKLMKAKTQASTPEDAQAILRGGKSDINMTDMEIQGQIHGIKQIKRNYRKEWDNMTFNDLADIYTPLNATASQLLKNNPKDFDKWIKDLFKRMGREKLLGANMKNINRQALKS